MQTRLPDVLTEGLSCFCSTAGMTPSNRQQVKVWVKLSLYGPGQAVRAVEG